MSKYPVQKSPHVPGPDINNFGMNDIGAYLGTGLVAEKAGQAGCPITRTGKTSIDDQPGAHAHKCGPLAARRTAISSDLPTLVAASCRLNYLLSCHELRNLAPITKIEIAPSRRL